PAGSVRRHPRSRPRRRAESRRWRRSGSWTSRGELRRPERADRRSSPGHGQSHGPTGVVMIEKVTPLAAEEEQARRHLDVAAAVPPADLLGASLRLDVDKDDTPLVRPEEEAGPGGRDRVEAALARIRVAAVLARNDDGAARVPKPVEAALGRIRVAAVLAR